MRLINHAAYRFLADPTMIKEMVDNHAMRVRRAGNINPEEFAIGMEMFYLIATPTGSINYIVTNTVLDILPLFDAKKAMSAEGWKVFEQLPDFKKTFILPVKEAQNASRVIRVLKSGRNIHFLDLTFTPDKSKGENYALAYWVVFWVDLDTNEISTNFSDKDVIDRAPFIYSLLAFTELTENTEEILPAGQRYGTRKTFKTQNIFKFPLIIINSKWNVTTIRQGDVSVCGHAQIYWTGTGRTKATLIYKEPFVKGGYKRNAGKLLND